MSKYYTLKLNSFEYAGINGSKPTEFIITEESANTIKEALKNNERVADIEVVFEHQYLWVRSEESHLNRNMLCSQGPMMINTDTVVYVQPLNKSLVDMVDKLLTIAPKYDVYEREFERWCKNNRVTF